MDNKGNVWIDNALWIILISLPVGGVLITLAITCSGVIGRILTNFAQIGL